MGDEWRVVQYFLSVHGVDHVEILGDYREHRCSCSVYQARRRCKHVNFVKDATRVNGGTFPMQFKGVGRDVIAKAHEDADEFRNLIAKHAKVEVL